jgi:putative transposase
MIGTIEEIANNVLEQTPEVVVDYRLRRDVLRKSKSDSMLKQVRRVLDANLCVQVLLIEQRADGGWGAFNSRNTKLKQKIPFTEVGVERAVFLGLDNEHLNSKGMVGKKRLAKHISDAGWGQFVGMLAYKSEWYGCELVAVDRFFPSSKTCGHCGTVMEAMRLHVRVWDCPICDTQHDRDLNAARNILKQATAGTAGSYADGVQVRPAARLQAGTQKSEAQQLAAG